MSLNLAEHYKQGYNGLFILKKDDHDRIAEMVLNELAPDVLYAPDRLDIAAFAENALGLSIRNEFLTEDGSVLGMVAFHDTTYLGRTVMHEPEIFYLNEGTVVIDLDLWDQPRRRRYTIAHECSHWILHRSYHSRSRSTGPDHMRTGSDPGLIACRTENIENVRGYRTKNSDGDWEEWQADTLAACLLMPRSTFSEAFTAEMRGHGVRDRSLTDGADPWLQEDVTRRLMSIFDVSYQAATIRMKHLGLLRTGYTR